MRMSTATSFHRYYSELMKTVKLILSSNSQTKYATESLQCLNLLHLSKLLSSHPSQVVSIALDNHQSAVGIRQHNTLKNNHSSTADPQISDELLW